MKPVHSMLLALGLLLSTKAEAAPPLTAKEVPFTNYDTVNCRNVLSPPTRALLIQAQSLEKAGKIDDALEKYREAFHLSPALDAEAELAFALARAGSFLPAARHLQEVLWMTRGLASGAVPNETKEKVYAEVRSRLGVIVPKVAIYGTRITVDGERVQEWPMSEEFFVEPGKHIIKAMAEDYYVNHNEVSIEAGEVKVLRIPMQRRIFSQTYEVTRPVAPVHVNVSMAGYSSGGSAPVSSSEPERPTWPRNLMIAGSVAMGVGVVGIGAGLVMRDGNTSDAWKAVVGGGIGILGLGVTGLGIGLASRPDPEPPRVYITPSVAKEGTGLQLAVTTP